MSGTITRNPKFLRPAAHQIGGLLLLAGIASGGFALCGNFNSCDKGARGCLISLTLRQFRLNCGSNKAGVSKPDRHGENLLCGKLKIAAPQQLSG
jgi:hypothetical protein